MTVGNATDLMKSTGLGTHFLITRAKGQSAPSLIHISSMAVHGLATEESVGELPPILHSHAYHAARWAAECYLGSERETVEIVSIWSPAIAGEKLKITFCLTSAIKCKIKKKQLRFIIQSIIFTTLFTKK